MAYIYRHLRLDTGTPFYIGRGTSNTDYNRAFSSQSRNRMWKSIANKHGFEVEIIFEHPDQKFIEEKEKEFILLYGRINLKTGILCNMTEGGTGGKTHSWDEKRYIKMRELNSGANNYFFGKTFSDEHRKKLSLAKLGKKINMSKSHKDKIKQSRSIHYILQYDLNGNFLKKWYSLEECYKQGMSKGLISLCTNGKRNSYRKYIWKKGELHKNIKRN